MKRLLMLSYPFPPNPSAGAVRSERFARHLPEHGWEVEVLTIKPRADLFEDRSRLTTLGPAVRVHFTDTLDPWLRLRELSPRNLALRAARSAAMKATSFPDHMLFWVPYAVREGLRLWHQGGFDAIYTTSPPQTTHLAGLHLARRTGLPWAADFRDPWTLNAYRGNGVLDQALLRVERAMERGVLRKSSVVLANTEANRENLLQTFPFLAPEKVVYLPNGWEPFPDGFEKASPEGPFTIVHAGAFYPKFKPFGLLHAIAGWKEGRHPAGVPLLNNLKVLLLGCRDAEAKRIVVERGLGDIVEIRPWVAFEEAHRIMSAADLLWATLGTGTESATYVPSKIYEYIAAGRPIIGFFPEGEAARLICETGTGVVFSDDRPEPIMHTLIDAMIAKRAGNMTLGFYKPQTDAISAHSITSRVQKFAAVLGAISNKRLGR